MLDAIIRHSLEANDEQLREALSNHAEKIRNAGRRDRALVAEMEAAVGNDPHAAFEFDSDGSATVNVSERRYRAGRFETASISSLSRRLGTAGEKGAADARLHVLIGASPLTDVGSLQARSGEDALFQVASQFNCLESPGPYVTPVARYFSDPTQGPRASISAFPATLLRHYRAPHSDGHRFVQQTDQAQIDLLANACGRPVCRNGYLTGEGVDARQLARSLVENLEMIEVGVHDDAQVVYGANWDGGVEGEPCIAQVFTSTVAGGGYGGERELGSEFTTISTQLLRAAYLGTLLATASLGRTRVVLTLIGGGVFSNPVATIWESILWALDELRPLLTRDLDIFVNAYQGLSPSSVLTDVRARGGFVLTFDANGFGAVLR